MGGQMEEQFNKDVPSEERRDRIIKELKKGKNLLISEKYLSRGKWSSERVARDALQNFFDGLGGTLDGVEFNVAQEGEKGIIDIQAEGVVYDFRRLLSLGGGSKTDSLTTAGGEGEGTRMMALHLLRDYGFSKVVFGAGDWEMEFYLAPDEEGVSPQEEDDLLFLHGKIKEKKYENRNYIHFETNKPEIVDEFIKAKDLFRHSGNEDFQHPDFENEKGGFKYHPDEMGNFYFNGQQVSTRYDGDLGKNLENLTLWANKTPSYEGKTLHAGRDRKFIAEDDIKNIFIPQFCEEMNKEDLELILAVLEDSYEKKEVYEESIDVCLLRNIVEQLKKDDSFSYSFNRKYLACDVDKESAKMLSDRGYVVCHKFFKDIGMKTVSAEFESFVKDVNVLTREQMESKEIARIKLLKEFISHVLEYSKGEVERMFEENKGEPLPGSFVPKEISVFVSRHPITGKYDEGEVFLKRELVRGGLADALATYKHELSHKFGNDQSAEFSYALTLLDKKMIAYIFDHPEALADLKKIWDENKLEEETPKDKQIDKEQVPAKLRELIDRLPSELEEKFRRLPSEVMGWLSDSASLSRESPIEIKRNFQFSKEEIENLDLKEIKLSVKNIISFLFRYYRIIDIHQQDDVLVVAEKLDKFMNELWEHRLEPEKEFEPLDSEEYHSLENSVKELFQTLKNKQKELNDRVTFLTKSNPKKSQKTDEYKKSQTMLSYFGMRPWALGEEIKGAEPELKKLGELLIEFYRKRVKIRDNYGDEDLYDRYNLNKGDSSDNFNTWARRKDLKPWHSSLSNMLRYISALEWSVFCSEEVDNSFRTRFIRTHNPPFDFTLIFDVIEKFSEKHIDDEPIIGREGEGEHLQEEFSLMANHLIALLYSNTENDSNTLAEINNALTILGKLAKRMG